MRMLFHVKQNLGATAPEPDRADTTLPQVTVRERPLAITCAPSILFQPTCGPWRIAALESMHRWAQVQSRCRHHSTALPRDFPRFSVGNLHIAVSIFVII